jgi:hypothetical protein
MTRTGLLALALVALVPGVAHAQAATEVGDAGSLPATAQAFLGPVDSITGTLDTLDQEDLYGVCLAGGRTFSASTLGSEIADTQLFLFDAIGRGVYANDDSANSLQAVLPAGISLTPQQSGVYYLGISSFDADPVSAAGPIFGGEVFIDDVRYFVPAPPGGDAPVSDWTLFGTYTGGYQIQMTGTTVGCRPTRKEECKQGRWRNFGSMFKNQGQCVAFVEHALKPPTR